MMLSALTVCLHAASSTFSILDCRCKAAQRKQTAGVGPPRNATAKLGWHSSPQDSPGCVLQAAAITLCELS